MLDKILDIMNMIAEEYDILFISEYDKHKYRASFPVEDNSAFCIDSNTIIIGKYDNYENMLIAFFHEVGHCLISREFVVKWDYSTLMIELECWNIGLKEARKKGFLKKPRAYL